MVVGLALLTYALNLSLLLPMLIGRYRLTTDRIAFSHPWYAVRGSLVVVAERDPPDRPETVVGLGLGEVSMRTSSPCTRRAASATSWTTHTTCPCIWPWSGASLPRWRFAAW